MALAQHLQRKHIDIKPRLAQQTVSRRTLSPSTSREEGRRDVTIATQKGTGRISVPERPSPQLQQETNSSNETVKYNIFNLHDQQFEYEHSVKDNNSFSVGSLKKNYKFWSDTLKANNFVLNVVSSGYLIPFFETPTPAFLKNNSSAISHSVFVENAINKLLLNGAVKELKDQIPFIVNPLSVSVSASNKERLILDLRHVNQFVDKQKFKFEGVLEASQFVISAGFMVKYDLCSGYHHIQIHRDHETYLGFSWKFENTIRYFVFSAMEESLGNFGHDLV